MIMFFIPISLSVWLWSMVSIIYPSQRNKLSPQLGSYILVLTFARDCVGFPLFEGLFHDCWTLSDGNNFRVLIPGGKHCLDLVVVDWFKNTCMEHVAKHRGCAAKGRRSCGPPRTSRLLHLCRL